MDPITALYIAQGLHGLTYGMFLFLVSSGLTLIFGMMGIMNIAHTSFLMLSAYFSFAVVRLTGNFWMALLLAPLAGGLLGALCERFLLKKVHAYGHHSELILTVGISLVILEGVKSLGKRSLDLAVPEFLKGLISIAGLNYPIYRIFVIVLALVILAVMMLLLYKTRLGMIIRSAVSDSDMVTILGINTPLVFTLVFGIGTWLAGVAGVAIAPILTVFPGLANQIGMDAFIVVVTGGLGSLRGAFIVSLLLGLLNAYGVQFFSQFAPFLMVIFMALVLSFKPKGLFGERE
jgi:branched-chain amino acid transport system permease protein